MGEEFAMPENKPTTGANLERWKAMQELRRSNAAQPHQPAKKKRRGGRQGELRDAIKHQEDQ